MKDATIVVRIDAELKNELNALAKRDNRTLSDFIYLSLKQIGAHTSKIGDVHIKDNGNIIFAYDGRLLAIPMHSFKEMINDYAEKIAASPDYIHYEYSYKKEE